MATEQYEYQRLFMQEMREQAESVVEILDARGITMSGEVRERILACRNSFMLDLWCQIAKRVPSALELFPPWHPLRAEKAEVAGGADGEPDLGERGA
ncbi:hypothetical protein ABGB18_40395 [Nonomuraea sp. B12E4]|uniref:hypothetical protein n=1 Tax=Nonomuraea sp. B12E4 TaxID=3153564 RepID=UPI00325F07BF